VLIGVRGDLRQVRHADDLMVAADVPQEPPDRVGRAPADSGVDLIEDQRRRVVGAGKHGFQGKRDARHLPAGRDARQRPRRLAWIRREQERDGVRARFVERGIVQADVEGGRRKADLHQALGDQPAQFARGGRSGVVQVARRRVGRRRKSVGLGLPPHPLGLGAAQPVNLGARTLAVLDQRLLGFAVLAHQCVEDAESALGRLRVGGGVRDPVLPPSKVQGDLVELGSEAVQSNGQLIRARVQAGQLACGPASAGEGVARSPALVGNESMRLREQRGDSLGVAGDRKPRPQFLDLAIARGRGIDLVRGMLGQLHAPLQLRGVDHQLA
jgi:hypothetical protein